MSFSSSEVVQINATVIIGLLILLSFQSFGTIVDKTVDHFYIEFEELLLEIEKLDNLVTNCENPDEQQFDYWKFVSEDDCSMWGKDLVESQAKMESLWAFLVEKDLADEDGGYSSLLILSIAGMVFVNIINLVMIIPFAISSIIEIRNSIIGANEQNNASKKSVKIMLIGFVILILGIMMISIMMSCSAFVSCL